MWDCRTERDVDVQVPGAAALRSIRGPAEAGLLSNAVHGSAHVPENVLVAGAGELLVDVDAAVPRMLADIADAKQSIEVAEYILKPTREGGQLLEALRARALGTDGRPPIEVSVLVDRQGTTLLPFSTQRRFYEQLERDGIRVKVHDSSFNIMKPPIEHRKLFVIDDDVAYVGGMGFGAGAPYHDVMMRLTGQEIVAQVHADFVGRWVDNGGEVSTLQRQMLDNADRAGQHPIDVGYRIVSNDGPVRDATRAIYALGETAKQRLWMHTPYFGSPKLTELSRAAVDRGVDTRLSVNGSASAFPVLPLLSRSYFRQLGAGADDGVRVLEQSRMSHEKVVLTEDWVTAGSTNLTYRSLDTDHEINVVSNDRRLMAQVEAMMRSDEASAHRITEDDLRSPLTRLVGLDHVRGAVRRVLESIA
jgi:cardiolipin synthase